MSTKLRKAWAPILKRAAEIVEEYETAVTLRQVFYRLVAAGLIENSENDYKHLSRRSADLRRRDEFPALLDRTRTIERPSTWSSPADALDTLARAYRRDLLATQATFPVIVVEKATLVAQLRAWFDDLCVPVVPLRGYASEALERDVIELVENDERDVVLLYCGDFDPTGEDIPRAFEENTGLDLRRVALTDEQVDRYALPPAPGKASDSRAAGFEERHGRLVQVELEALDPDDLRRLIADELDDLVDLELVELEAKRERTERARLVALAEEALNG
ncbi:MAG: DUF2399 domain-containing protein [Gaiellaceae bacterium]